MSWIWGIALTADDPDAEFAVASVRLTLDIWGAHHVLVHALELSPPEGGSIVAEDLAGLAIIEFLVGGESVPVTLTADAFGMAGAWLFPDEVPEPASLLLLGAGLAGVAAMARKRGRGE